MPDVAAEAPAFLSIPMNYNTARRRGRDSRALQDLGLNVKAALKSMPQSLTGCLVFELCHNLNLSVQILKKETDKPQKLLHTHINGLRKFKYIKY